MGDRGDQDPNIHNHISGGHFQGPVYQIRDVHGNITFTWAAPPQSSEEIAFRRQFIEETRRQWARQERERMDVRIRRGCGCIGSLAVVVGLVVFYSVSRDGISTFFLSLLAIPFIRGLLGGSRR
ncbi:hypothetical protein [Kitasatospora purpeofusca]|uniref:hypothetical protein n=1 Tax=Kitasatospora purpeofusca TaxID=67352 RepID=UPI002A5A870C|nr:hypothetical protein [Kitasatospora purpeofusca]MDY0811862.1 hypothetical protein [Kitasatospora purpeofusca]